MTTTSDSKELYIERGARSTDKIFNDIATGKAAEIAAFYILKPMLKSLTSPDFTAYPIHQKSYAPDLSCNVNNLNIHVKSTTRADDPSWLFMKNDPVVYGNPPGQNIAALFTITSQSHGKPPVATLLHLVTLDGYTGWQVPYMISQKRTKVALYSDTLKKLSPID